MVKKISSDSSDPPRHTTVPQKLLNDLEGCWEPHKMINGEVSNESLDAYQRKLFNLDSQDLDS